MSHQKHFLRNIRILGCLSLALWTAVLAGRAAIGSAQSDVVIPRVLNPPIDGDLTNLPGDLRAAPIPGPANLGDFIKDVGVARALGKALFWDMQVGSDGVQACASCHFRAGADPRSKNQVSPGLRHAVAPDLSYKAGFGPNVQLQASDFPLSQPLDPGNSRHARSREGQQRRRLVTGDPPSRSRGRSAGIRGRRHQHEARGAAEHAVGHQCRLQSPAVLGRPCGERVQRRQPSRATRSLGEGVSGGSPEDADRGTGRAHELQPRLAGGRAHRQRSGDGGSRPLAPRCRP